MSQPTTERKYSISQQTAQTYYNSTDADNFYFHVWGGEDIHVGVYESDNEPIAEASRRTVERMLSKLPTIDANTKIIDCGSGYGGAARYIVRKYGCHVTCLNVSERENERNREFNQAAGLSDRITVIDGCFEEIPVPDGEFDVVWSEDAFLHSGDKPGIFKEVTRILKSGGHLIFTDPMQGDNADPAKLTAVHQRIHLESMGSFALYEKLASQIGLRKVELENLSWCLTQHYGRVLRELTTRHEEIAQHCSLPYINNMKVGLNHWINAGNAGLLSWGILHFAKP